MIRDALIVLFMTAGTFFMLVASVGIIRLPDIYLRLHAMTKAATLGIVSLLVACAIALQTPEVTIKAVIAVFFHFLTAPVGGQMIARAAYSHLRAPFWKNTHVVEWDPPPGKKQD